MTEETPRIEVIPAKEIDDLLKAVKSLISDIESMRCMPDDGRDDSGYWFGLFSDYVETGPDEMTVEWPNLAISLAAVKKLLEPKTIEGELTKPLVIHWPKGTRP